MKIGNYIELADLQDLIAGRIGYLEQWVRVEIDSHSEVRGHHYFGLLQKTHSGEEVARARGIVWKSNAGIIPEFYRQTGQRLEAGISVVVLVVVQYSPRYGLSLVIQDIDASYSIGLRELQKQETLRRLEAEGLLDRQKSIALPFLPSGIAVISSKDAAGYGDFMKHLSGNQYGYTFDCTLFQSLMQGDRCPLSISASIDAAVRDGGFDLILILRGGGAESDLFCYDDYQLGKTIAECPLPVLTAVGHERDYHVADMVANSHFKTPTALADFLVDWVAGVEEEVMAHMENIMSAAKDAVQASESEVGRCLTNICFAVNAVISGMENRIALSEAAIMVSDPRNILKQGYVLAVDKNGTILKNAGSKSVGEDFSLRFSDGVWNCVIEDVKLSARDPWP